MKRLPIAIIVVALIFSLMSPGLAKINIAQASTNPMWNDEMYGDRMDIDRHLEYLSKDTAFIQQKQEQIKQQASQVNFDEVVVTNEESGDSNFTYDGGTKYFLNRDLSFKEFTLRSVGDTVEIWVAEDLSFPEGDPRQDHVVTQEQVDKLKNEFDQNIYPKATSFFGTPDALNGSESPLIEWGYVPEGYYEGDKVIILVDNIVDENYYDPTYPFFVAGFFWSTIESYINRNIITIDTNSWATRLESTFYPTTIHELQHLIHADNDPYEESWINEGMSTFSEFLGGYGLDASSVNYYLNHPENSLVKWDDHYAAPTGPETIADYGQVYLFTLYMHDKFGQDFIRSLAVNPKQGIEGINEVLTTYKTNLDFSQLYQNFITALALDSSKPGNGLYKFESLNIREIPVDASGSLRGKTIDFESALLYEKEGVPAWGGDFKSLDFQGKIQNITFDGIDFLPIPWMAVNDPLGSDNQVLWANTGDEADNIIIFEADLTGLTQATLTFDNYIQIEEQWDFGVVQVSTDGGSTWTSLANENTRSDLVAEGYPKIYENLPGFTGYYDNWQQETFDLSAFAGNKVLISFRYLTDWGYNDPGWFIDNINIPEIGLLMDGTSTEGFLSMNQLLNHYVNYTVTFINETVDKKGQSEYKVVTVEPFTITEEDALNVKQLFKTGKNYMITTYAAPIGDRNPVSFTYEINLKSEKVKNK
ncbi:MAG: peptidase [Lachnospiraceae bacterium]|jgi:hypothetical protein|nr:peptidase [Lachnospiraceae bacterium]